MIKQNQNAGNAFQRAQPKQGFNQYNDENNYTVQSQLEETLSLSISDLNTIQPQNMTMNSFRNSLGSQAQFLHLSKNIPSKKGVNQQTAVSATTANQIPLQVNQNYLNQQEGNEQTNKAGGNSYLNTYNLKKQQLNSTQGSRLSSNSSMIQGKTDKMGTLKLTNKQIKFDTEESCDQNIMPPSSSQHMRIVNNAYKGHTSDQEKVSSNSSVNNLDKIKALTFNGKLYNQGMNSIQSLQQMLQSNQNFSTQSMCDGNFSITSYGLNQYYLLNMHHIVRIQKFLKIRYSGRNQSSYILNNHQQIQQKESKLKYPQSQEQKQQEEYFFQDMNYLLNPQQKQQQQTGGQAYQHRRQSTQQNVGSTFVNSYQHPLDINMSNINNNSNSFNLDVVSFGQKDNMFQNQSERSLRGANDQVQLPSSYQNQTFEEVEEVEEEEEQTPIHHFPNITACSQMASGGFEQHALSLQRLQSVDIDNIQGRFEKEDDIKQVYANESNSHQYPQKSSQNIQLHKDPSTSQINQKITQHSPKFPTNIDNQLLKTQQQTQQQNGKSNKVKQEENEKPQYSENTTTQHQNYKPESQQSTSSGASSHNSLETLKQENSKLKKMMYQMKQDMKSQLEEGLVEQKNQMKTINDEYLSFIEKIMADKKELTKKCEVLFHENQQLLQQMDETQIEKEQMKDTLKNNRVAIHEKEYREDINNKINDELSQLNDEMKEKLRKTEEETDSLYEQLQKQQDYILKIQKEKDDLSQKIEGFRNNGLDEIQKSRNKDRENDETIIHLQSQLENVTSQLHDERLLSEELQNQLVSAKLEKMVKDDQKKQQTSKDLEEQLDLFKSQFVQEITEKVEELQSQLEKERQNVSKLLYSSKIDGNEIVNQLRIENISLKQQLVESQSRNNQKEPSSNSNNNNQFDSVKIVELENLISQMDFERKQACEMVVMMKEAHEKMKDKYEDDLKQLKEKHATEFCKYEENIRYSIDKKDQSIEKLYLVINNLQSVIANSQEEEVKS